MKAALIALVLAVMAPVHATVAVSGALVVIPVLWLVAAAVVLALAAAVLWLVRSAVRDGGFWRLRPRVVIT